MIAEIKVTKRTQQVLITVENAPKKLKNSIRQTLSDIGDMVGRETKRIITTGKRSGRVYSFNGRTHRASAFGEAPANRTGRLAKSYDYRVAGWNSMTIGESAEYAKFLEDSTKFMKPRQHLILAINKTSGQAVRMFYDSGRKAITE